MALALPVAARAQESGRTLRVGPAERFRTLHDAVRAATSGDVIEVQPGEYHGDVAVAALPRLTIRGLGSGAVAAGVCATAAADKISEAKAMLRKRGRPRSNLLIRETLLRIDHAF